MPIISTSESNEFIALLATEIAATIQAIRRADIAYTDGEYTNPAAIRGFFIYVPYAGNAGKTIQAETIGGDAETITLETEELPGYLRSTRYSKIIEAGTNATGIVARW